MGIGLRNAVGWGFCLALAACSSSSGTSGSGTPATDTVAGGDVPAAAATITIQSFKYNPADLSVAAGSTITVKNLDAVPHTLTSEAKVGDFTPGAVAGVSFDTGTIASGGSATITIPASAVSGTVIPYFCAVHLKTMGTGQITVK